MGVLTGCKPRKEVLKGDLDDAIFAADFGDLIEDKAPAVYGKAAAFFQNTHPAQPLRKLIEAVFGRLANSKEPGAAIRLSTGFGGGKTHTLMALWHLGKNIGDHTLGTDLLPAAGRPKAVTVAAVDGSKAGVPVFARHGKTEIGSLWGELAYWLGGENAARTLGKNDDPESQPDAGSLEKLFPPGPVLILLDELVVYMATLSDRGQGNVLALVTKLAAVASKRPQTVLVVTDPGAQAAFASQSERLRQGLVPIETKLDEVFGRKMSDFDPIGDESAEVIIRRLFERVDSGAAQAASATYHSLYDRVAREKPNLLTPSAAGAPYAKSIVRSYPFHPRLLDTAKDRLGALQEFNKSRGTLRLFARILRSIWESKQDLDLITAGDVEWSSDRIQADLLQRLNRDNFKPAVSADIDKHATELDGGKRGIHVRVASALLLESLPMHSSSGLDAADLTLAVLRPDEAGPEPTEALDRLVGVCWHTYPMAGGRGYQFRYEPNIIKQIEERMGQVPGEDARSRVVAEAQGYFAGPIFKLAPWPESARQVPETAELQLALCEDEKTARSVCDNIDDSNPGAPLPRRFQNSILAITATQAGLNSAIERARRLLAAERIESENRTGDQSKLVREQLQKIKPELQRQFRIQTCRTFDRVVLPGGRGFQLEERYQVSDEQMLQRAMGQKCLKDFLDDKKLIFQPGDALDVDKFLSILPGATPSLEFPEAWNAKAIHERFLGASGLRLVPDGGVVRQTLLRALAASRVAIRLTDGRAYEAKGCVEGPTGHRRRIPGTLTTFPLDDSVLVAPIGSATAASWLRTDSVEKSEAAEARPVPVPPDAGQRIRAMNWQDVTKFAAERPLLTLQLKAETPAAAASLSALAQPLGADALSLSVTVSGSARDGGNISFAGNDLKPTHPVKPLAVAQTLHNALIEGSTYEAVLTLGFGLAGRTGLEGQLRKLAEEAPDGISPEAEFDRPIEGTR